MLTGLHSATLRDACQSDYTLSLPVGTHGSTLGIKRRWSVQLDACYAVRSPLLSENGGSITLIYSLSFNNS